MQVDHLVSKVINRRTDSGGMQVSLCEQCVHGSDSHFKEPFPCVVYSV